MKNIVTWYRNLKLNTRVILSMNFTVIVSILLISVLATINRINVQKNDAGLLVQNELAQVVNLLELLENRPLADLEEILKPRLLYNTGFVSVVSHDGIALICRKRNNENISSEIFFTSMRGTPSGEVIYTDPVDGQVYYQFHRYYQRKNLYITATLEKKQFIDLPVMNTLRILLFAMIFLVVIFSLVNYYIMKSITTPINGLMRVINGLSRGNLTFKYSYPYKDEVGQMTKSVNNLLNGLQRTADFALEIGKNNFDHPFEPLSDDDVLGKSLIDMRASLKTANDEEKLRKVEDEKRNWTTQGLAKFADILRQNNTNIQELTFDIIKNLVDYLGVNQGGVFILNDEDNDDKWLELTACYAFDRRKYLKKKIMPGEGLVGACFLERQTIYLTKIPKDYIRITSGLGDENPSSLLLIPLKLNEAIYGVIELASFKPLDKYKLEFVEKIGESIASTISSVKINTQTAMLLAKSQQQAEEMRAQEEEMRQNMEELAATQEAMAEKERDNIRTIEELTRDNQERLRLIEAQEKESLSILDECPEGVVKSDKTGEIIFFNKAAETLWGYSRSVIIGKNVKMLMPENDSSRHDQYLENYHSTGNKKVIGKGRVVEILTRSGVSQRAFLTLVETSNGKDVFYTGFFTDLSKFDAEKPLKDSLASTESARDKSAVANEVVTDQAYIEEEISAQPTDNEFPEDTAKSGNETTDSDDLPDTEDPQKAWTEHISQKGKTFRKGKKKL